MRAALLLAHKDLLVLSRDKLSLFWVFVFPVSFALFFGNVLEEAMERASGGALAEDGASGFVRSLPTGILWGLMSSAATFAVAMVSERTRGTLHRLRAAPISAGATLAGKALACLTACLLVSLVLVVLAVLWFDARVERPLSLLIAVLSAGTGFVGITVLLGATGKTEQSVTGAGWAVLLASAMVGGAMVPTSLMPDWLRSLGSASPVRWGLSAVETALLRGDDLRSLATESLKLLALGVTGVALSAFVLRRTARA